MTRKRNFHDKLGYLFPFLRDHKSSKPQEHHYNKNANRKTIALYTLNPNVSVLHRMGNEQGQFGNFRPRLDRHPDLHLQDAKPTQLEQCQQKQARHPRRRSQLRLQVHHLGTGAISNDAPATQLELAIKQQAFNFNDRTECNFIINQECNNKSSYKTSSPSLYYFNECNKNQQQFSFNFNRFEQTTSVSKQTHHQPRKDTSSHPPKDNQDPITETTSSQSTTFASTKNNNTRKTSKDTPTSREIATTIETSASYERHFEDSTRFPTESIRILRRLPLLRGAFFGTKRNNS